MICEYCGKEHLDNYGSGRFCNASCKTSFTNVKRGSRSEETKRKISEKLKSKPNPNRILKTKNLIVKNNIYYKICKICGREYKYIKGENSCCNNDFCKKHNYQHFPTLIKYFGFDKTKLGTIEVENEFNRIRNLLYDLYWNQYLSSTEICKIYNYPQICNLTHKVFKNILFIPIKNCKQSVDENIFTGRQDISKSFMHGFGKEQWYTTWNGKEVFLRSSNELKYAQELDEQQIDYDVESLRIKYFDTQRNEYRCAIPDFYIPSENMIVEIKSEYTLNKQNMIDKKKAYLEQGYKFKCICDFNEIEI